MYKDKPALHKRQAAFKRGEMRSLVVDVTSRCNMQCPHCYAHTFSNVAPVKLEHLKKALQEAHDLGAFHFVMMGGEPLVAPERLEAVIKMCHPSESFINVVTNGWNVTPEVVRWLKDLQVDKICFSLDSGIEAQHDANRKQGAYKRVLNAIDLVINEGLLASISTVVTHASLHAEGFAKAVEYAKSKGIRIDVQIAMPVGKWDGNKDHCLTAQDALYLKELNRTEGRIRNGQKIVNRDVYSHFSETDYCPAGTEFMAITVDGQVQPCNFLQMSLGNIKDKTFTSMREAVRGSRWFDGKHTVCLCGEDHEFIDICIVPYKERPKPLDAYSVFNLTEK